MMPITMTTKTIVDIAITRELREWSGVGFPSRKILIERTQWMELNPRGVVDSLVPCV